MLAMVYDKSKSSGRDETYEAGNTLDLRALDSPSSMFAAFTFERTGHVVHLEAALADICVAARMVPSEEVPN